MPFYSFVLGVCIEAMDGWKGWSSAMCECIEIPTECNKQCGWEKDRIWETDGVIFSLDYFTYSLFILLAHAALLDEERCRLDEIYPL
jgi:hypothetical protein